MATVPRIGTDHEMISEKGVPGSRSDEYLISILNEDEGEQMMESMEAQSDQQKTGGRAISHPSSINSMEDHWYRSMSGLAAEMSQEKKRTTVRSRAETQENGTNSDGKWYEKIIQAGKKTAESGHQGPKFAKVPPILRINESKKQNVYTPSFICIGPYHSAKKRLRQWDLKAKLAYSFVRNSMPAAAEGLEDETERFDKLFRKVQEVVLSMKQYYYSSDSGTTSEKEFVRMMFLDGCFVLQFVHWSARDYRSLMSVMNDNIAGSVRHDLLLLENQIPFQVLTSLIGKEMGVWRDTLHRYFAHEVCKFFTPHFSLWEIITHLLLTFVCSAGSDVSIAGQARSSLFGDNPRHLLAFFHSQFINNRKIEGTEESKHYSKYSAKELKKVGVHFKASKTPFFTDVTYEKTLLAGELTLPQITIDEASKSMLLNLVAYEYCHEPAQKRWVTSYACFMDSLINDAEDVKVLRSKGILFNFRETDGVVADLFNEMGTYLVPNPSAYVEAKRGIDEHCKSSVKKWVAEFWRIYFRSPWSIIAVVAAALAIFLTAVQTYFAAFGTNN